MARIRIIVSRHSAFYSPLLASIAAGFLAEEGLQADYEVATAGRTAWHALKDGSADLAQSAVSASWGPLERGERHDLVHFAQINQRDGFFIAGRRPDPDFTWDKLAGREVLVDHFGQPLAMFKYAVHRQGVRYADIGAIDSGEPEAMEAAFRGGRGDYVHLQGPAPQQLEKDGIGHVLAAVGEAVGPVAFSSLLASRRWLATDAATAFMRAYRKARVYVNDAPTEVIAKAEGRFFPGIDAAVLTRTIAAYRALGCWPREAGIPRPAYETALDVFLHAGAIKTRHSYDAVVAPPPDET
jgi:NitT/TauT family transport system substrate-binding protein